MPLIAPQIRAFAPAATPYKKTDERGLYLEVFPNGSKLWRLKYYVAGKEKRIALGGMARSHPAEGPSHAG